MVVEGLRRGSRITSNRVRLSVEANRTIFSLVITLGVLIVALSVSYLLLNNQSAQKVYKLSQVQDLNNELQNEKEGIEAKLVKAGSASEIEETKQVKNMEEPENKTFLKRK